MIIEIQKKYNMASGQNFNKSWVAKWGQGGF